MLTGIQVMNRDRRLTGFLRGQTANPVAPDGYELNNPWRVRDNNCGNDTVRKG